MIFDPSSAPHLKPWLIRTLEPICDAEPGALADYILALLKHNVPESDMRKELAIQLDEFLEKAECSSFIDTLFTVLRTKSYLPYSTTSPPSPSFASKSLDTGIPIPLDGLLSPSLSSPPDRTLKRSIEHDERDGRPPAKGPRLSTEGQFSRYANDQSGRPESRSTGGWGGRTERYSTNGYRDGMDMYGAGMGMPGGMVLPAMNGSMSMNGHRPQIYQPPDQKRGVCRDYYNNGYCARGAMCKYSHGEDAVVPNLYSMNGAIPVPFMPMFGGAGNPFGLGGVGAAYDPHEARMDMRPIGGRPQRAPLLPRIQQEDGSQIVHSSLASGELPVIQDLTPAISSTEKSQHESLPQPPQLQPNPQQQQHQVSSHQEGYDGDGYVMQRDETNDQSYIPTNTSMNMDINYHAEMEPPNSRNSRPTRGGSRNRGGTFGGEIHNFRPERRNDRTLVVEKIPEEKLSLEHVNEWFKRFGTVTNVAIDSSNAKALISFAKHEEAYAAWKSEDAVFGNRFVKLFWHRPMEGHGQTGAKMLAASAPLIANMSTKDAPPRPTVTPSKIIPPRKSSTTSNATAAALAAKQLLLEQQIAEQKALMGSLDTASPEEKKTIMARLRKLGEEMKPTHTATPSISTATVHKRPDSLTTGTTIQEQKERDRLDKELEMHNATVAVEGEDNTDNLKAKLERLKAEAASLGIAEEPPYGGGYRPYRGRGRGGRGYRGAVRGGPPLRASMKLDNRPKKLLVKGIHEDKIQALRDWFETTGQVESLERADSGDVVVAFKSRAAAEQGLSKGNNVPTIGPVHITWYTGKNADLVPVSKTDLTGTAPSNSSDITMKDAQKLPSPELTTADFPHNQEEEVATSGWGEDGDVEDGMGML